MWLRRVYLDLTGRPPTAVKVKAFVDETKRSQGSSASYEKLVDRILAAPAYGERWGRHFMDIWRYSDRSGLDGKVRRSQNHLWHWRDWIVDSLNADKGYDRMILEMLAADEVAPKDRDALRATGFLARNYYVFIAKAETAFSIAELALAAAEARPPMLRAVVAADRTKSAPAESSEHSALLAAAAKADATYQLARAEVELAKARQAALTAEKAKATEAKKNLKTAEEVLATAKKNAANSGEKYTPIRATRKAQDGPEDENNVDFQSYPTTSTGRRLAFAQWLVDQRNPLTARVLVNHLWTRHFGASLVPDVSDLGLRCPPPLHQDVLDTLAVEFMQHGWSLKHLHRVMVLSQLYRRSSSNAAAAPGTLAADPDNACYWRMNPRRLESQALRDALLHAAGLLDLRVGGPSVDPEKEASSVRRAIYFAQSADREHRFLAAFDNSNVLECYRRQESIVPQQALALANSKLTRECADVMVKRTASLPDSEFIENAFLSLLSRVPTPRERTACLESLAEFTKLNASRARTLVVQALMNHNDFVTLR